MFHTFCLFLIYLGCRGMGISSGDSSSLYKQRSMPSPHRFQMHSSSGPHSHYQPYVAASVSVTPSFQEEQSGFRQSHYVPGSLTYLHDRFHQVCYFVFFIVHDDVNGVYGLVYFYFNANVTIMHTAILMHVVIVEFFSQHIVPVVVNASMCNLCAEFY